MIGKEGQPEPADDPSGGAGEVLRRRAERIALEERGPPPEPLLPQTAEDAAQTLHRLHVHQIELEMQNEELRRAQTELDAARARYFDLYDLAPVGYCTVGEKGLIVEANLTAATLLGVARGELVKQPVSRFILDEDQDAYYRLRQQLAATGEPKACELRMVRGDGTPFWGHMAATAIHDTHGASHWRFVLSDVTGSKRTAIYRELGREILQILNESRDLKESAQRVLTALKTRARFDAVGIRLQDGDDFPYFAQQGFPEGFLLTENTLIGRGPDGGVCRDEDGAVRLECTCGLVLSGKTDPANPLFTRGGSAWTNDSLKLLDILPGDEPRFRPRNQCVHRGYASVALVPIRIEARVVGLIQVNDRRAGRFTLDTVEQLEGIASLIGAALMRKRAEEGLQKSEERNRTILQTAMDGFWLVDTEGRLLEVNEAYCRMSGFSARELLAMRIPDLEAAESAEVTASGIQTVKAQGEARFESLHRRKDGSVFEVEVSAQYHAVDGGRFVAFLRDITGRKQLETTLKLARQAAESADRAKSRFLANVSHDLRTPMNAILGMTELALGEALSPDVRDHLETARDAALDLLELVNELLDFSRMKAGVFQLEPAPFHLRTTLERTLKTLRVHAAGKGLELVCIVAPEVPDELVGDALRLRQVLVNLVGNALKFTEEGHIRVDVTTLPTVPGETSDCGPFQVSVQFAVADTGIGIAPEDQERVFSPFTQVDESGARLQVGTGLGLSISAHLAQAMGGQLRLRSQPHHGSTFLFTALFGLPPKVNIDPPPQSAGQVQRPPAARPLRILLAEDSRPNQKVVVGVLSKRGHVVEIADNGIEAVALATSRSFDVILMDLMMPGVDGIQATAAIRAHGDPTRAAVPIVALTAHAMKGAEEQCLASGMTAYLSKPVRAGELIEVVERFSDRPADRSA